MACQVHGDADMYGIGIRVGFYLQWYFVTLAAWIAPGEVHTLRLTNTLFSATTFLATIIQLATGFNPVWDPTRFPRAPPPSKIFKLLQTLLLVAVMIFQIWFWSAQAHVSAGSTDCESYGFFFYKIRLGISWFRILNCVISGVILLFLVYLLVDSWIQTTRSETWDKDEYDRKHRKRILAFQIVDSLIRIIISTSVIVGTELTIRWNNIRGVNVTDTSGQLIPLCLGVTALIRIICKSFRDPREAALRHPAPKFCLNTMSCHSDQQLALLGHQK
ncbi:hypothetical protein H2200_000470 [Cladophialophora chaetospira]|uniref:Uncharacterized protein n=1 Tax=Cladophialophora chaetospira TaxID=386627 RepID=A0AA39CR04_9EURO|nr:hypothetical protein H2200_000470 [Cladophialophora chaetospira]